MLAGYLARLVREPAWEMRRAPTCSGGGVRGTGQGVHEGVWRGAGGRGRVIGMWPGLAGCTPHACTTAVRAGARGRQVGRTMQPTRQPRSPARQSGPPGWAPQRASCLQEAEGRQQGMSGRLQEQRSSSSSSSGGGGGGSRSSIAAAAAADLVGRSAWLLGPRRQLHTCVARQLPPSPDR